MASALGFRPVRVARRKLPVRTSLERFRLRLLRPNASSSLLHVVGRRERNAWIGPDGSMDSRCVPLGSRLLIYKDIALDAGEMALHETDRLLPQEDAQ